MIDNYLWWYLFSSFETYTECMILYMYEMWGFFAL